MVEFLLLVFICLYIPIGDTLLSMVRGDVERILFGGPFIKMNKMWLYLIVLILWPLIFSWIVWKNIWNAFKGE